MTAAVLRADAAHLPLADESVDLVVTSPPYFALRSYTDGGEHYGGQIGAEPTPQEYLDALLTVAAECTRVLKPSGSMFWNLGDKYAGSGGGGGGSSDGATGRASRPPRRDVNIPTKSLMLLPERFRIRCVDELGLITRAVIVWDKPNGLPESVTDRVRRSHEDWVHLTKQPRYYSAVDEVREKHIATRTGRDTSRWAAGPSGNREIGRGAWDGPTVRYFATSPLGKLPGSVWRIATEPLTLPPDLGVDHFAAFPTEWPKRLILGWSPREVCTACGEGRRPITSRSASRPTSVGTGARDPSWQAINHSEWQAGVSRTVTGYVCACTPLTDHMDMDTAGGWGSYDGARSGGPRATGKQHVAANYPTRPPRREYHLDRWQPAPSTSGVVLDPFGGTGTTAHVASALGRHGISVDMSADYCRVAAHPELQDRRARKVLDIARAAPPPAGQADLLSLLDEEEGDA